MIHCYNSSSSGDIHIRNAHFISALHQNVLAHYGARPSAGTVLITTLDISSLHVLCPFLMSNCFSQMKCHFLNSPRAIATYSCVAAVRTYFALILVYMHILYIIYKCLIHGFKASLFQYSHLINGIFCAKHDKFSKSIGPATCNHAIHLFRSMLSVNKSKLVHIRHSCYVHD